MLFDPENTIVKLCAAGMEAEGKGEAENAKRIFDEAWKSSRTDMEKVTSAHYVARHQPSITDKLHWDLTALLFALKQTDEHIKSCLPSLYLNVARCYEEMGDRRNAEKNYNSGLYYISHLPNDGYGQLISSALTNGLKRLFQ